MERFISKAILNLGVGTEKKKSRSNLWLGKGDSKTCLPEAKVKVLKEGIVCSGRKIIVLYSLV